MRTICAVAVATLAVSACAVLGPSSATAVVAGCATGINDFDGNGATDLTIGAPYADDYYGAVFVKMRMADGVHTKVIRGPHKSTFGHLFGWRVGEVDLSDHTDASVPCSTLVVSKRHSSIFLYRWDAGTKNFVLLNRIDRVDIAAHLRGFGSALAAPLQATARPAPRPPVLYVGAGNAVLDNRKYRGAVVRLVLTRTGHIAHHQIIEPGASPTASMPLTVPDVQYFGKTLAGTPDPDEVIVGAPSTRVNGHKQAGAVLDWRRGGRSTLITQNTRGVPGGAETDDYFGSVLWLSHEAATATGTPTYLFVGAPAENVGSADLAGAAWQFRYRPRAAQRLSTRDATLWTQASRGVHGAGRPERYHPSPSCGDLPCAFGEALSGS